MKLWCKSIFAGCMIGIACMVSLQVGVNWVGAILFSVGLVLIVLRQFKLFTGMAGYASSPREWLDLLICLSGNLIGVALMACACTADVSILIAGKLAAPLWLIFVKGVWCGFLMFIAVDEFKRTGKLVAILLCVPAFILAGFEHSIADAFYVAVDGIYWESIRFLLVVIAGNVLGGQLGRWSSKL